MSRSRTPRENGKSSCSSPAVFAELKQQIAELRRENAELRQRKAPDAVQTGGHGHGHGGGVEEVDPSSYLLNSFVKLAFRRFIPLSFFLVSLSFTAVVMDVFEHTLKKQLELAYFVPLLIGQSGNTGGQTVGTVLSVLTAGKITTQDWFSVVLKEAMSGLTIGIVLVAWFVPLAMAIMGTSLPVALVVGVTIPVLSCVAAALAAILPFVCLRLGLEPADIAAPAMTTIIDVLGLLIYFVTAGLVLNWFGLDIDAQQQTKTKNEYDNYYCYSNGCMAACLFIVAVKVYRKKFGVAPSNEIHLTDARNQHMQRGLAENSKERVHDEIQKRCDAKVISAHDNIHVKTKKYDEIQKSWDGQVLGA